MSLSFTDSLHRIGRWNPNRKVRRLTMNGEDSPIHTQTFKYSAVVSRCEI